MAVDSKVLLNGLQNYYFSLEKHLASLRLNYQQLENQWRSFNSVAEGNYADQFRSGWMQTQGQFQEYINQLEKIKALLKERIEDLSQFDRQEDRM
ncbi:MAG: hypothetical protein AAFV71_25885 [Cyanobacteria bacterium J06633_8]